MSLGGIGAGKDAVPGFSVAPPRSAPLLAQIRLSSGATRLAQSSRLLGLREAARSRPARRCIGGRLGRGGRCILRTA